MSAAASMLVLFFLFLALHYPGDVSGQENEELPVRMIFYNAGNLFDTYDDPLTADDEFLPDGVMRWNYSRYRDKILSVYKVIVAAGDRDLPALAGFCEIENRGVLEKLTGDTPLSRFSYGIVHAESSDPRGIDAGLIYRRDILKLLSSALLKPGDEDSSTFSGREVLYAKFLAGDDTLHIFMNHWPSRRGGVLAGGEMRIRTARMIRFKADSICRTASGSAKIIIAGDFNSTPGDSEMLLLTGSGESPQGSCGLINLSREESEKGSGTYKYRGTWEMIDQVIVSGYLLSAAEGLHARSGSFRVFTPGFLLTRDPGYPGLMPFSTYRGYRYAGGFSDHLPVILDLFPARRD